MSFRIHKTSRAAALVAILGLCVLAWDSPAFAQSDDVDPEARIQQLENQLRQLTGQNEELQYRNRQLEERLRMLQSGAPGSPQGAAPGQPGAPMTNTAALPPAQPGPSYQQQPPVYQQQPGGYPPQAAAPAPIVQEPAGASLRGGRRGDAFDPTQNPNAPGAPRALGGGQLPMPAEAPIGAPGGRGAGEPLDLANTGGGPAGALPPPAPRNTNATGALTTLPPSATPRDEFDLGVGYVQRKDYALAEETMRNFQRKYPNDPMMAEAQFWLGESFFQRQQFREAAEAFLGVTTKFDRSAKAPDALLRLGQSLAALKEKEAACAAFGEVARKYPRAAGNIKQAVDREQKRSKC
jgi:tol-pal system protein YbgF